MTFAFISHSIVVHFPFFFVSILNVIFSKENLPKNDPKITYRAKYVPMSVVILSNIPKKEETVCIISEEGDFVKKIFDYLEELFDQSYELICEKLVMFLKTCSKVQSLQKKNSTKKFYNYFCESIVWIRILQIMISI